MINQSGRIGYAKRSPGIWYLASNTREISCGTLTICYSAPLPILGGKLSRPRTRGVFWGSRKAPAAPSVHYFPEKGLSKS